MSVKRAASASGIPAALALSSGDSRQFVCLEAGRDAVIEADTEEELVPVVQEHVAELHNSFELDEFILPGATEVDSAVSADIARRTTAASGASFAEADAVVVGVASSVTFSRAPGR